VFRINESLECIFVNNTEGAAGAGACLVPLASLFLGIAVI